MGRRIFLLVALITVLGSGYLLLNKQKNSPGNRNQHSNLNTTTLNPQVLKTTVIAQNLEIPWALVFLPDKSIIFTERPGRVRFINANGVLQQQPIATLADVKLIGEGGLLGVTIHPNFSSNHYIYFYYTYSSSGDTLNKVVRFKLENNKLSDQKTIIDNIPGASYHDGGRIKFGPDGYLYITTGDAQNPDQAQDPKTLGGKTLRVTDEGAVPSDNPFGNPVYSYGHRNSQGLAWDKSGQLWETEHGPSSFWPDCCQDEINRIQKGGNYGWPQSVGDTVQPGTIGPVKHSGWDTWAPSGAVFIGNSLFFAGLKGQTLYEAKIQNDQIVELKTHLKSEFGRLREAVLGPDGMLYVTTSNRDGRGSPTQTDDRIIRVNPNLL